MARKEKKTPKRLLREKFSFVFKLKPVIAPLYIIFRPLGRHFGGHMQPAADAGRRCLAQRPNKHANIYICTQTHCVFCSPPGPHMLTAGFQRNGLNEKNKNHTHTMQALDAGGISHETSSSRTGTVEILSDGSVCSRFLGAVKTRGNLLVCQLVELSRRMKRKEPWKPQYLKYFGLTL